MGFREVSVVEVREVLRAWVEGAELRKVAPRAGVDRKTARRYVAAAQAAGLTREAGTDAITDELIRMPDEPAGAVALDIGGGTHVCSPFLGLSGRSLYSGALGENRRADSLSWHRKGQAIARQGRTGALQALYDLLLLPSVGDLGAAIVSVVLGRRCEWLVADLLSR